MKYFGAPASARGIVVQEIEHVAASTDRAARQSATENLAESRQIRRKIVYRLGASGSHPKTTQYLIENEQRADRARRQLDRTQKARRDRNHAKMRANRLDDDRGDLRSMLIDCTGQRAIIPRPQEN